MRPTNRQFDAFREVSIFEVNAINLQQGVATPC